ncbi:MAG: hypothetical protein B7Y47_15660 [Sphingomonas sp. 28-63-12]|nr:MAG: hypothetical protein B7Y47_15660 [Sphingomonas sp. 28-63-12]
MLKRSKILLLLALMDASLVAAQAPFAAPTGEQIRAALDEKAESDFVSYLQAQPPGTAAGHVVRIDAVTGLTCNPVQKDVVVCRFVAHQGLRDRETTSTLIRKNGGWHIVDQ